MRTVLLRRVGAPLVLIGLAACTEPSAPLPMEPASSTAAAVRGCELASAIGTDGRKYFPRGDEAELRRLADLVAEGCRTGEQSVTTAAAWDLLALLELAAADQRGEDDAAGSRLINTLVACTLGPCRSADLPGVDFLPALGPYGILAVGGDDQDPAIAHGWMPFIDASGTANEALWGVEVTQPWSVVTAANPVLVYGGPGGALALKETVLGGLQYSLDVLPDLGTFIDGALHVGTCFAQEITLPHVGNDHGNPSLQARMQREGVLLSVHTPGFCPPAPTQASLFASIADLVRPFAPAALRGLFRTDSKIRLVGGTPLDFSTFAPVGANPLGTLELVTGPISPARVGQSLGPMRVRVSAGGSTVMERVLVTVRILNNQGIPAGAILSGPTSAYTSEADGQQGIAVLDGVSIGKPGGYTLCFTAEEAGFAFQPVCADLINVRQ